MAFTTCSQLVRILTIIYIIFPNIYLVQSGDQNDWDGNINDSIDWYESYYGTDNEGPGTSSTKRAKIVEGFNASSSGTNNESNPQNAVYNLNQENATDCARIITETLGCTIFEDCVINIFNDKHKKNYRKYDNKGYVWKYITYTSTRVKLNKFSSPDIFCENIKLDDFKNEKLENNTIEKLLRYPKEKQKLCLDILSKYKIKSGMDRKASFQKLYLNCVLEQFEEFTILHQYFYLAQTKFELYVERMNVIPWCNENYPKIKP